MAQPIPEDLTAYFRERNDFMRVVSIQNPDGGWDIYLRIDGTYATEPSTDDVRNHTRRLAKAARRSGVHY